MMTRFVPLTASFIVALTLAACSSAPPREAAEPTGETPPLLTYHQLALKDLDEMVDLVKAKIKESRSGGVDHMIPLREGVRLVYMRPDDDGMIDKVVGPLRSEVEEHDDWINVLSGLVDETLIALREPESLSGTEQVGHVLFLQNVMADEKPRALKKDPPTRAMFERIRDADIQITRQMKSERKLRMMKDTASPSTTARQILSRE